MGEIILVRHGETRGQSSIRLNGITDVHLSDLGQEQMRRAARSVSGTFDRTVASPLIRSQQSLSILSDQQPEIVDGLREIDFGRWEALTWAQAREQDPEIFAECGLGRREFQFPGGESRIGFYDRVAGAARATFGQGRGRTLAVLHKGVIKICLATLCGLDWDQFRALPCDLGSIHRLEWHNGWQLVESNRVDHLGDAWLEDHPAEK